MLPNNRAVWLTALLGNSRSPLIHTHTLPLLLPPEQPVTNIKVYLEKCRRLNDDFRNQKGSRKPLTG